MAMNIPSIDKVEIAIKPRSAMSTSLLWCDLLFATQRSE